MTRVMGIKSNIFLKFLIFGKKSKCPKINKISDAFQKTP